MPMKMMVTGNSLLMYLNWLLISTLVVRCLRKCSSSTINSLCLTGQHTVQRPVGEVHRGSPLGSGMVVEPKHGPVEVFDSGVTGHPDATDWPAFVAVRGHRTVQSDLFLW